MDDRAAVGFGLILVSLVLVLGIIPVPRLPIVPRLAGMARAILPV